MNLFRVLKLIKQVTKSYTQSDSERYSMEDGNGDKRLDYVVALYREISFPLGLLVLKKHLKTSGGRDVLWARGEFDPEYVEHTNCVLRLEQSWIEAEAVKDAADSIWIHSSSQPQSQPIRHCAPDYVTGGCL